MRFLSNISSIFCFGLILVLTACTKKENTNNPLVAEFLNKKLYLNDIATFIPPNIKTQNDSIAFINFEVEEWIRDQIIMNKSSISSSELREIDHLVSDYRNNLIKAHFEKIWIQEHLDTLISKEEIEEIKKVNPSLYKVEGEWIKCSFAKARSGNPELDKLDQSWKIQKMGEVQAFCNSFAEIAFLDNKKWTSLEKIKQLIPKKLFSNSVFTKKGYNQKSKNGYEYFLYVNDYKKEGNIPDDIIENNIKKIIIQKRKMNLLKSYKESLYDEAMEKNQIKFYINKEKQYDKNDL